MKNSSFKHPFPTFSDKMFDGNKDGKLDLIETSFRDAHLDEINSKREQAKPKDVNRLYSKVNKKTEEDNKQSNNNSASSWLQIIATLIAIMVLFIGIIVAVVVKVPIILKVLIIFGTIAVALSILKAVGLYN